MAAEQLFCDIATQRLSEQIGRVDALDAKAATVFSFATAVLPIFAGLLTFQGKGLPTHSVILLALGFFAYGVAYNWSQNLPNKYLEFPTRPFDPGKLQPGLRH